MKCFNNRKTWGPVAAVLLAAALTAGCGSQNKVASPTGTESQAESGTAAQVSENAAIPNPMEEVKDANSYGKLGIHMVVPDGAADVQYYTINGEVADIRFTLDGVGYTWRASNTAEDFAGIFERFKEDSFTVNYDYSGGSLEAAVKTTESGGRLAEWAWGDTAYTLYTSQEVPDTAISSVVLKLMELSQNEK